MADITTDYTAWSVTEGSNQPAGTTAVGTGLDDNLRAIQAAMATWQADLKDGTFTLVTPVLGTPTSGVATNLTGTAASLTAGAVTTNANLTGHVTSTGNAAILGSFTSLQLKTALTDETGSGAAVFATSPILVTPALGTPSSGVISACTSTSMVMVTPILGTPTSGDLSNCTGAPAASVNVADTVNPTCWVGLFEAQTGAQLPKSDGALTYNAGTGLLSATTFSGAGTSLTGTAASLTTGFGSGIVSGTKMVFYQASAPTGWTAVAVNEHSLRVVTAGGTGGTAGGSVDFSTHFASQASGSTAITEANLPAHVHTIAHTHTGPSHTHTIAHTHAQATNTMLSTGGSGVGFNGGSTGTGGTTGASSAASSGAEGTGATGASSAANSGSVGSTTGHTHTWGSAIKFADVIIATKD